MTAQVASLILKLESLPTEQVLEVEDFIDFLRGRWEDRRLAQLAARSSETAFAKVWDNPDDAAYDAL